MKGLRCPICDRELTGDHRDWPNFPFCSERCRKIDLGRWLSEQYRIPVVDQHPEWPPKEDDSDNHT